MPKDITEINKEILHITESVVVSTPRYSKYGGYDGQREIYTMDIAKALYNAGYRKQSEGEWIWTESGEQDYEQYWLCSCCNEKSYIETKYCSDCGAKMKGGA